MLAYIWIESWSLRQAIRFVLNGYDYGTIIKMAIAMTNEIKYRKH